MERGQNGGLGGRRQDSDEGPADKVMRGTGCSGGEAESSSACQATVCIDRDHTGRAGRQVG